MCEREARRDLEGEKERQRKSEKGKQRDVKGNKTQIQGCKEAVEKHRGIEVMLKRSWNCTLKE